ncbi:MAG: urease accessory protein UreE [Pseudomonadota bacterium]
MPPPEIATRVARAGTWNEAVDTVTLDYESRFLRRRRVETDRGATVIIDLPETLSLAEGDALILKSGAHIGVHAAGEPLLEVRAEGSELARLAWHIGNRHTPAEILPGRIRLRRDHVMASMLAQLGAHVAEVEAPFSPEGGAYGLGRTHRHHHDHSHTDGNATGHSHSHDEGHAHGHDTAGAD